MARSEEKWGPAGADGCRHLPGQCRLAADRRWPRDVVGPSPPSTASARWKAPWLPLARTDAERALFARIRSALDPSATLNPNVLPRW